MLYGFNDRQTAEKLKEFASNIGKLPSQSFPVTQDNGSRVFLVSLSEPIGAMSKDSSSIGSPSAANAKILKRNTSNELEVQKNAFSDEDYFVTVQNVSGNAIPQTSDELLPEEIHLAVQDSFGGLFLVPQVSELFGTLESSWSRGDDTPQSITLDAGFERSGSVFTASPAPTLSEDLPAGTAVTCRFIKAVGKWFFFRPSGGGTVSAVLSASGTALGGFGTHGGKSIWATQLALGSEPVDFYRSTAVLSTVKAVGSGGDEPWISFPTAMTGSPESVSHVRGNWYRSGGEIFLKKDIGTVYVYENTLFYPVFQKLNGADIWKSDDSRWVYFDGNVWTIGYTLGRVADTSSDLETQPWAASFSDLGLSLYQKPIWRCDTVYGVYHCAGEEDILFGVPQFTASISDGSIRKSTPFVRSLKRDQNGYWKYSGSVTIRSDSQDFEYSDISRVSNVSGLWTLGRFQDPVSGWYESREELSADSGISVPFTFTVVEKDPLYVSADDLFSGDHRELFEDDGFFCFRDDAVSRWSLSAEDCEREFIFTFNAPDDETSGEDLTVTLHQIMRQELDPAPHKETVVNENGTSETLWILGTYGSSEGWHEAPEASFDEVFTFTHGPVPRREIEVAFDQYAEGNFSQEIWHITPEILT